MKDTAHWKSANGTLTRAILPNQSTVNSLASMPNASALKVAPRWDAEEDRSRYSKSTGVPPCGAQDLSLCLPWPSKTSDRIESSTLLSGESELSSCLTGEIQPRNRIAPRPTK